MGRNAANCAYLRRRITPKPSNALPSRTRLAGSGTRGGVMAEASMTPVLSDGENTFIAKYWPLAFCSRPASVNPDAVISKDSVPK